MFIPGRNGPRPAYSNFFYIILIGFEISKGSETLPLPPLLDPRIMFFQFLENLDATNVTSAFNKLIAR